MNSSFVAISILMNSHLSKKCLINILMNMSSEALWGYLELGNIYKGNSPTKKTNLIEMIVYGCITDELYKNYIKDISTKELNEVLSEHKIILWIWKYMAKEKRNQAICRRKNIYRCKINKKKMISRISLLLKNDIWNKYLIKKWHQK